MKTQLLTFKNSFYTVIFIFTLLSCNGCSKNELGEDPEKEIEENSDGIDSYIKGLSYNASELLGVEETGGLPLKKTSGESTSESTSPYGTNTNTVCNTTPYNLKTNFESIAILKPNEGIIWPGALVIGDANMKSGLPTPLTLARAPMTLRLGLPGIGDAGTMVIDNPSNSSFEPAKDKALEWWNANAYEEGYINPASFYSEAKTSYSSKQASIELGMNAEWASNEIAAQFDYETTSTKRVAMMSFKQIFYTITMDTPINPSDVFDASVSLTQIENAFNSETPPAYIHSVSYGRIIMFRMESSSEVTASDFEGAFEYAAGKNSASGSLATTYQDILKESNITTVVIGGNAEVGSEAVSARDFGDLEKIIKGKNAVYSRDNPGVAISYSIRYLKDDTLAKMGSNVDYEVIECKTSGSLHNAIKFTNGLADNFRIGIDYKNNLPGQNSVDYDNIVWKENKVNGSVTYITPPEGAYDITYHVERAKLGTGYETKLTDYIGGYVHDYEDCFESYPDYIIWPSYEAKVKACD